MHGVTIKIICVYLSEFRTAVKMAVTEDTKRLGVQECNSSNRHNYELHSEDGLQTWNLENCITRT